MTIIDAHIHFCGEPHFDLLAERAGHRNTAGHLEREYARLGIAGAVVMGNRSLDPAHHVYPGFMRYCVGLDSSCFGEADAPGSIALVEEHLARDSCVGVKLYPGYNTFYVYDDVYRPYLELAGRYKKPVAIHTGETAGAWGLLKYSHPLTIDEVAGRYPGVEFVMCHLGNPWVTDAAVVMRKNPNVSADLSGMLEGLIDMPAYFEEHAGYIRHLKTWLHYMNAWDRLMYGTDWPLANLENYIALVRELIPEQHRRAVFADNARRIYRLDF